MSTSRTVMGKMFHYRGSLAKGVHVVFDDAGQDWFIPREIIDVIKTEIAERSPVAMGASRRPLLKDSLGETLYREHDFSPLATTYVVPLLIEAGYCHISPKRPYLITLGSEAPQGARPTPTRTPDTKSAKPKKPKRRW